MILKPQYYHPAYLIIITVISIICYVRYDKHKKSRIDEKFIEKQIPALVLTIFMILFIGTRPLSGRYFIDMAGTASYWNWWNQGDVYEYQWGYENKLYDNLRSYMSTNGMHVETFFFIIAFIYFMCIYIASYKLFPKDTLFALLVYYAAFSTFSYATNGIKAGSASALFLVALAYTENLWVMISLAIISWGFHHSMIMVVASLACVYFFRKTYWYFILWGVAFVVAVLHIGFFQSIFSRMVDVQGAKYLILKNQDNGFRLDFIIYSIVPIIIGYYTVFQKKIQSNKFNLILNLYLLTNSVWMLCMYAEFTNRIAYLSWFLHPWVMIYPFLNEKIDKSQYKIVNYIAIGHLCFTLFLNFIYWR